MSDCVYYLYRIDLTNPLQPKIAETQLRVVGKKASYRKLREIGESTLQNQIAVLRLPNGQLRKMNNHGEISMFKNNAQSNAIYRLFQSA